MRRHLIFFCLLIFSPCLGCRSVSNQVCFHPPSPDTAGLSIEEGIGASADEPGEANLTLSAGRHENNLAKTVQTNCFNVEVVQTKEEMARGLMFRTTLPRDSGMLFFFPRSHPYSFWMKNTKIPLDMIWLDDKQTIVHIEENVPPCLKDPCPSYVPSKAGSFVLEVNAGEVKRLNLRPGDHAELKLQNTTSAQR